MLAARSQALRALRTQTRHSSNYNGMPGKIDGVVYQNKNPKPNDNFPAPGLMMKCTLKEDQIAHQARKKIAGNTYKSGPPMANMRHDFVVGFMIFIGFPMTMWGQLTMYTSPPGQAGFK